MEIFERVKTRRKELGMSAEYVAEKLGISPATMYRYERNDIKKFPSEILEPLAKVLHTTPAYLMGWEDGNAQFVEIPSFIIPVFENVSAGFGTMAIDSVIDYVPLPFTSVSEAEETICIRVKGDSMSPDIKDGDLIQVHKQSSVDNYDIAVVLLDGDEGFVKKVEYGENYIKLISLNPGYKPIILEDSEVERCSVVGKVKKVIRDV